MSKKGISIATAEKIRDAWPDSSSLKDAMANAGLKTTDERSMRRYRRDTEELLGIKLPAHNEKFSTHEKTKCSSTLDLKEAKKKKSFIITYCVNNCPINSKFLDSLEVMAKEYDSQILIIPKAYRNPDDLAKVGFKDYKYKWPERVKKYILNEDLNLGSSLTVSSIGVKPTVKHPLGGKDSAGGRKSVIYGHSQVGMIVVPTPSTKEAKKVFATGAISRPRYPKLDSGRDAAFNHSMAALFVHLDGNTFHTLNLHWSGSGFYFLNKRFTSEGIEDAPAVKALVQGDSHAVWKDDKVLKSRDKLMDVINPEVLCWHDLHDHKYQSHHATPTEKIRMALNNEFLVEEELKLSLNLLNDKGKGRKNLIIGSNHNDHIDKWLDNFDQRKDPHNALFAKELHAAVIRSGRPAFEEWMHDKVDVDVEFIGRNDYYTIAGIDVSQHGDVGGNGTRATARGFSRYSYKTVIGHSHCLTAGHDVLTKNKGWIGVSEVKEGDQVLSYKDGKNEYVNVDETFEFSHTGKLITVGGKTWRQTVTDKHNMFMSDGSYIPITEAIVTRNISEVPLTADPIDDQGQKDSITATQIRKIVAYCADGSIQDGRYIRFQLKKGRKIDRLNMIFGPDLKEPTTGWNGAVKISLTTDSQSHAEIMKYVGPSKRIPEMFLNMNVSNKMIFINELSHWDGTFDTKSNGRQWSTSKKSEADIVSQILTELGYRNTCKMMWGKKGYDGCYVLTWGMDKDYKYYSESSRCDKERINGWKPSVKRVENEPVYCLSNKNNNFWVRSQKTGQTSLTGNSPRIEKGCYQMGVSTKKMSYAKGYSSWCLCDCIIYPDGKRSMIFYKKGKNISDFYK